MNYFDMKEQEEIAKKKLDEYDFSKDLKSFPSNLDLYDLKVLLITYHPELEDIFDLLDINEFNEYLKLHYEGFFIQESIRYYLCKYSGQEVKKKI